MCLILSASQCFAISGGPFGGGSTSVVGIYAGVIKRPSDTPPAVIPVGCLAPAVNCSANSLGVFSVGVPASGISSGTFVMFSQGRVFTGTIRGTADPSKAVLTGVLNATFNFSVTTFDALGKPTTTQVTASANGKLKTKITNGSSQSAFGAAATRLAGTATLNTDQGEVNSTNEPCVTCFMTLRVVGFKQSNSAPTASASP